MTQTEPEPGAERTALDLRPDGRIVLTFSEETEILLRRPTLGQFRRWRLRLNEVAEESASLARTSRREAEADLEDEALDEEERLTRRITRLSAIQEASEVASEKWWVEVFDALAEEPVPPVDDWPPFLVFGDGILQDVLQHWRAVPLAPGPRSNQTK